MKNITISIDDDAMTELLEDRSLEEWQTFAKAVFAERLYAIRTRKAEAQKPVIVEPDTSTWDVQIEGAESSAPVDVNIPTTP